ncbi:MAG: hypothetical protein A2046_04050 [Bacteroidetes bacterium GWA2_30_7]|nr:MAG: hypothetical protein A2046_04050 [Bacteroidetes bacterium GWA2_30_7]
MDINKQIEYWLNTAEDDLDSSEILISKGKILHGLFFCHLCIEKVIKANVVRCTNQIPPKVHRLAYLLSLTDIELSEEDKDFCAVLMAYQLEGRYPENYPSVPNIEKVKMYLNKTKTLFQWLKTKL